MSDTPRTDAFYAEVYKGRDGEWITLTPDSKAWEFARQLERELARAIEERMVVTCTLCGSPEVCRKQRWCLLTGHPVEPRS